MGFWIEVDTTTTIMLDVMEMGLVLSLAAAIYYLTPTQSNGDASNRAQSAVFN